VAFDGERVTFKWKDYRAKSDARYKLMTLDADEFIRRFLIHVLPDGFHRIRHYGLFANANRAGNIALARRFLGVPDPAPSSGGGGDGTENCHEDAEWNACPCCGGRMIIIEPFDPAASRGCGRSHRSGSIAHDRHACVTILRRCTCPMPGSRRQRPRSADGTRQRRLPPPNRRSLGATSPFRPQPGRPTAPSQCSLARHPNPRSKNQIKTRALNPHSPTAPPTQTPPAVSSLEAFRTPASVHALAPVTGRRPKPLNDSRLSGPRPGTGRFDPKRSVFAGYGDSKYVPIRRIPRLQLKPLYP